MLLKDDQRKEERRDELDLKQGKKGKRNHVKSTQEYTMSFSKHVTVNYQFVRHPKG